MTGKSASVPYQLCIYPFDVSQAARELFQAQQQKPEQSEEAKERSKEEVKEELKKLKKVSSPTQIQRAKSCLDRLYGAHNYSIAFLPACHVLALGLF